MSEEIQSASDSERKVSALLDILEAMAMAPDLPVVLNKTLKAAMVATQSQAGFIHLRDRTGKALRLVTRQGISGPLTRRIDSISTQDGLVAWVTRHKQSVLITNIIEDPRTVYLQVDNDLNVYLGAPIAREGRVWGTLSVLGENPDQFGREELSLLTSIGEEIGIVLENIRLRRQAERHMLAQERNRLARELHDSVSQSLYSITLFAEAGRRKLPQGQDGELAGYLAQISETGNQALKEMRSLVHSLRPSILVSDGLVRALQQRLNSVEGRAGVKSQLLVEGVVRLTPAMEEALYQIAQEALNNALKHAMASEVVVRLSFKNKEEVVLRVEDNGRGFDPQTAGESDGMGLINMKERAESFGGRLDIRSALGQGTVIETLLVAKETTGWPQTDFDLEYLT